MQNEKLYREFQNLERKIQLLLNENKNLKDELAQSKNENQMLEEDMKSQKAQLDSFQSKMKMNKIANNMIISEDDSVQLKVQIDDYIKKIEKCIAHLAKWNKYKWQNYQ